jgi:type IV pilus assembly protein PilA
MAVLVGVLAPQYLRYVEQSRRATDIQTAENIRTAILADIADGTITISTSSVTEFTGATSIATAPTVAGNKVNHGGSFYVEYDVLTGTCEVYPDSGKTYNLTDSTGAASYKTAS